MNNYDEAIHRLGVSFSHEFAEFLLCHEKVEELFMDLAAEFVEENIPVVADDAKIDVAAELITSINITKA